MLLLPDADQKVVWFDIPVEEAALMDELDSLEHLNSKHKDSLEAKLAPTILVKVLKRRPKQIHDEHIEVSNLAVIVHLRHADSPIKDLVQLGLVVELWELRLGRFKLNGYFLACFFVLRCVIRSQKK